MSVLIDTVGEYLSRTTSLPDVNGVFTFMGWVYRINDLNALSVIAASTNAVATNVDGIITTADGVTLSAYTNAGVVNGSVLNANEWHHVALVRESPTSLKLYLDGVLDATNTNNVGTGRTVTVFVIGGNATLPLGGRYAGWKQWSAALTIDEVKQEIHTLRPQRYANLVSWFPMWPGSGERTRDYSGAGLNLTENGTISDADPPPVTYGAVSEPFVFSTAAGDQTISPSGIASTALIGSPTLTSAATISPSGIGSTTLIGEPTLSGAATISPSSISSTTVVGDPVVSGATIISPPGVESTSSVGEPTLTSAATISPGGIDSTVVIGSHSLTNVATISPSGVSSTAVVGSHVLSAGNVTISPTGIPSTILIGNPIVSDPSVVAPDLCFPLTVLTNNPIRTVVTNAVLFSVETPASEWVVVTNNPLRLVQTHNPVRTVETVCDV